VTEFPLIVVSRRVRVPELSTPPPSLRALSWPVLAWLPRMVVCVTVATPLFEIPPPSPEAKKSAPAAKGARAAKPAPAAKETARVRRQERMNRPPTWKGAFQRAGVAAALFAVLITVFFKEKVGTSIALAGFMLLVYVPLSYITDRALFNWRKKKGVIRG
jgi:hypothetical protein